MFVRRAYPPTADGAGGYDRCAAANARAIYEPHLVFGGVGGTPAAGRRKIIRRRVAHKRWSVLWQIL